MPTNANVLLSEATPEQRKWVAARLTATSDAAAARAVGIHPSTVSKWPNKAILHEAIASLLADPMAQALEVLADALPGAAKELVSLSKDRNHSVRIRAVEGVLDRGMGKPTQKVETEHSGAIRVVKGYIGVSPDDWDDDGDAATDEGDSGV